MINTVTVKNLGPLPNIRWKDLGNINVILGKNCSGKTMLMKALYTTINSLESYKRGNEYRSLGEILANNLYWTFQVPKLGNIVSKGQSSPLYFEISVKNEKQRHFSYMFSKNTTKKISFVDNTICFLYSNSIFLPAKEVLSIYQNVIQSYERYRIFGFDSTYVDLAKALNIPEMREEKIRPHIKEAITKLEKIMMNGKMEFDNASQAWIYKKRNTKYSINITAESIKKIGTLNILLKNGYLNRQSIVFIDEPEAFLNLFELSLFLEIIADLAKYGMQFFIETHSHFVPEKLSYESSKRKVNYTHCFL